MGTAVGGSLDAWREARKVIGDEVIAVIRQGGWDFDLVDDGALAVLPSDTSRPMIISGATELSDAAQDWFQRFVAAGGAVITVDSAVDLPGSRSAVLADVAETLSAAIAPDVRTDAGNTDIGVVHRRTPEADVYLVINTGPTLREFAVSPRTARTGYEEWDAESGRGRPRRPAG